ncbi:MAG: AraC family transcriptional regulator, partial [Pseudomonadota bacterium]
MTTLDTLLRGGAIGLILLTAGLMLLRPAHRRQSLAVAAACLCLCCYLLVSNPEVRAALSHVEPVLITGAKLAPLPVTWMLLELFYDDPFRRWPWLLVAGIAAGLAFAVDHVEWASPARGGMALALFAGLTWVALATASDDLVEKRRAFRRGFVAVLALTGVVITAIELGVYDNPLPSWIFPVQAGSFLIIAAATATWALQASPEIWPTMTAVAGRTARPKTETDPRAAKLLSVMESGLWQREGLTVGALADELGMPEHQLRRLINGQLGHRNFSTFVNGYRVTAAKAALADPARADQTVLQIAYDCGFASIGPFNRAFRA